MFRAGYPLNTLFLLIAACAAVLAMLAPMVQGRAGPGVGGNELLGSALAGGMVLTVLGAIVGLFHYERFKGVLYGILVGAALGLVFGPVAFIPISDFPLVLATSIGGALLIVAVATVLRLSTDYTQLDRPPVQKVLVAEEVVVERHPLDPEPDEPSD
jgi:hypothetical protein